MKEKHLSKKSKNSTIIKKYFKMEDKLFKIEDRISMVINLVLND